MKKGIIYSVLLSFMFMLCGVFYGCGGRYDDLSMSAFFEYDTNLNLLENDDDEIYRYQDEGGLRFDDNKDGSYTFYITPSTPATVSLKVEFDGMPDDFNKLASVTPTNELVATVKKNVMQTDDGCVRDIVIHSAGETSLNVLSDEGEKTVVINIKAVEIPTAINFVTSNYALAKNNGSYIDLSRDKAIRVVPSDSSVLKINYSFGSYDGFDFVPLTDEQLWQNGLSFNKNTNLLSVAVASQLDDLKSLWIEADYENPVGDNLKAYTQVKIVNVVDVDSFKIYTPQDELIEGTQDLINNVTDLNYMDVRLKVVTNGEKINFGIIDDGILPINEIDFDLIDVIYIGEYDSVTNNYADAYSAYVNLRIIASKKTVENANYNSDGIYNLKFTCNYADYTVAGYPITYGMDIKIYDLVKQFSINDEPIENEDLSSEGQFVGDCQSNVYINTANSAEGTVLKIGIANPANILKEYSRYTLSLYQFVENQSAPEWKDQLVSITNVAEYFKIKTATQVGGYKTTVSETMTEKFDKDTFFYIKADETSDKIAINQIYYLVIKAELPNDAEKQAVGVVRLDVVQGITAVQNYSYFAKNYQVDAATGKHTRVDPDSKEVLLYDKTKDEYYKLTDASLPDSETNRTYLEGELVEEVKNKNDISFEDYVGNEVVYIDLTSNFNANVILSYLPDGANLENLTISSSNNAIMQIGDYEDEFGVDISQKVAFSVVPKAIGEAEVLISASHLEQIYKIPVSIYKPITNMFVALSSTSWESGIGQHTTVIDAATQNKILESAVVMVGKSIVLNISTLPVSSSGYTLQYNLYEYNQDASGYDMANPVGEYIKYYDGKASDVLGSMKNTNGVFTFNCKTNIFMFTENASVNDKVLVCIKLINLDGTYIERYIELSSFMPVVSIDTNPNRDITLTNPNTIAYDLKKDEKNNDSVFALNIAVNKDAIPASFDFYNNGHITVLYNGQEEFYELRNGKLVYDLNNKILLPVQSEPDINGNYFFKLNPEYNYSKSYNTIVVMIDIKEFDNYFSKFLYVYMRYNTMVSSLITQNETDMYFKQGITDGKTFGFEVENDRADNKTVLSKVFNIVQLNNKIYYVESDPATTNTISNVELKLTNPTNKGDYTFEVVAENAGEAVVVLMPQDKIISKAQYDTWNNYSYQTININSGEFVTNFYYTFDGKNHVLAEEYDATQTYYIKSVAVESYVGIWADYLTVYITVADGDKVPYQISSINDLNEVSKTVESVTKRYVLVENLNFDTTIKWQPIGNYYVEDVDQHNYEKGKYYIYNGETYEISNGNFELGKKYYLYGFNGEFNFKYKHVDIKQNIVAETD